MSSSDLTADDGYQSLLGKISEVYATGQTRATQAVNAHITLTYWRIGHDIVEFLKTGDPLERSFYEQQTLREKWAVRELQRQMKTSRFQSRRIRGN